MNTKMKKLVTILTPLVLIFAFASPAQATCDVERLHVVRSEGGPGVQIYDLAPPTVLPTFYYRFTTSNNKIIFNLNAAWVGNFTVRVQGDAASCGETGTIRSGGNITFIFRDSFF